MRYLDGSGISWTICKQSASRSREITTPTPHHSIFTGRTLFLMPNQQCQLNDYIVPAQLVNLFVHSVPIELRWIFTVACRLLLMSLVEELCVLPELTVWSCLQSDWLPSAAELFRSSLPTPGTLFLNTPSQLLRCSHLSVIWKHSYCSNPSV